MSETDSSAGKPKRMTRKKEAIERWKVLLSMPFQVHWNGKPIPVSTRRPLEIWAIQEIKTGLFWASGYDVEDAVDAEHFRSLSDAVGKIESLLYYQSYPPGCVFRPVLIGVAPTDTPESILPRIAPAGH